MPFIQLIEFGFELCALYTHRLRDCDYTELPCALTSAERIQTFLEGCDGLRGVRAARLAVKWIKDRSRSVRESKFTISMTLPRAYGGQGVKCLDANVEIPLTLAEQKAAGKRHYEIDLYSRDEKIGFEYLGEDGHSGPIRELRDIRRESILAGKGIVVHGVTNSQAKNVMELERLAKLVVTARGDRWRKPTPEQERAMRRLVNELYGRGPGLDATRFFR
ncbi:MAG: hypothetical protein Q4D27_07040 [Coriobacteriia bacterium]|nr:hypothetical protein [Coriobacteriia bacterium]